MTSVIFVLSGIVFFFLQRPDAMDALANLEGYDASEIWSEPVEGEYVTVGVLRRMVQVELWSVLVLNLVLGAVMVGLFVWAKRAAFPALVTGASIYVAVQVLNAIVDPRTLGQGLVMRIIVIMAFYKGVKAASELRGPARATVEK